MALPDMRPDNRTADELADLTHILEDASDNFAKAAEEADRSDVQDMLEEYSEMFNDFGGEVANIVTSLGGTVGGDLDIGDDLRRMWTDFKTAFTGDDAHAVLVEAEKIADKLVDAYEDAMEDEMSPDQRSTLSDQFEEIEEMHDRIRTMRDAS